MKFLTLCADDYSQSPSISGAILRLVDKGRLNAVSCLTGSSTWAYDSRNLFPFLADTQIGLHFNLTLPFEQPAIKVSTLLLHSLAGKVRPQWVKSRLKAQWSAFERCMGRPPDFLDGHQHVHLFPGIREIVVEFVAEHQPEAWIRSLTSPYLKTPWLLKQRLLVQMNRSLTRDLARENLRTNPFFAGFRNYVRQGKAARNFLEWFRQCPDGTLIMCHPGMPSSDPSDPIRKARAEEYDYLSSADFLEDLEETASILSPAGYPTSWMTP